MKKLLCLSATGLVLALLPPAALAMQDEVITTIIGKLPMYAFTLFLIVVIISIRDVCRSRR